MARALVGATLSASFTVAGAALPAMAGELPPDDGVHVDVGDFYFAPGTVELARGGTAVFDFVGPSHHTATDSSGLELYDSGLVDAGGPSTWSTFPAAGVYAFVCTPHTFMGGRVVVPVRAAPARGPQGTTFTVTWAASAATDGRVYDVQIRRPGRPWTSWRRGVVVGSDTFEPSREGRYRFRARMRDPELASAARWSPADRIRVG